MPNKTTTPLPQLSQVHDFSGAYVGALAGYSFGSSSSFNSAANSLVSSFNSAYKTNLFTASYKTTNGFEGGVCGGFNFQFGSIVTGFEADSVFGSLKRSATLSLLGINLLNGSIQSQYNGTARLRLGYAFGNALPYLTGGLAWANEKSSLSGLIAGSLASSTSKTELGYALGGGLEYAFSQNILGRVEYLYSTYQKFNFVGTTAKVGLNIQQVRAGIAYKF